MTRYFFHIRHRDNSLVIDDEGGMFDTFELARAEAVESLRDLIADNVRQGNKVNGLAIEIADESRKTRDTVDTRD